MNTVVPNIYFIGIGGIGMSAIARYYHALGCRVLGYDKTPSALTDALINEGVEVSFEDDPECLPAVIRESSAEVEVIVTPAIPKTNRILSWFTRREYSIRKRAEALGDISNLLQGLAVAGTHGKTTTSAILAHLLTHSGKSCNAFLGGVSTNYNTNLLIDQDSDLCVIEADEFDRSFHRLSPSKAIITNIDPDHLDIYGSGAEVKAAFAEFASQVQEDGLLVLHEDVEGIEPKGKRILRYGFGASADVQAKNVRVEQGCFYFNLWASGEDQGLFMMPLPGRHNIANALAAIAICLDLGVEVEKLKLALKDFKGVKRRFEFQLRTTDIVYIDDYAHHPSEIHACVSSVRELFPEKKVTGVFQPHLFSRTRDFMSDFAESLSTLDELILLDIYPAREKPIEGIDSQALFDKVALANKVLCTKETVLPEIQGRDLEILLTLGAGDIDRLVKPISKALLTSKQC